ncbi:hypothetical protein [Streptomyces sp. CB01881]|uniref:hypothetical protein n=1 Tax=Streptomyces sp. CB01881 TaxID=2078691 RepID=UPI0018834141|nr:hypothetical protein [Streptomyces sp. CB01881]
MAIFRRPGRSGEPDPAPGHIADELAELVEELEKPAPGPAGGGTDWRVAEYGAERGRRRAAELIASVARRLGTGSRSAAKGAAHGGRALADQLIQAAPRIPVRNLATLRSQHPTAADPDALAQLLILGAARASAALGAGVGAAAMLPVPPAMPVEIAAETLAVAAVEIKLIAELHEVYGVPAQGTATHRASAYLGAWAGRRGINATTLVKPAGFAAMALGGEVRQQVRKRLTRSTLRRLPTMIPLLVGAGLGATINRRDTRKVGRAVRKDLRSRRPADGAYWSAAAPAVPGETAP